MKFQSGKSAIQPTFDPRLIAREFSGRRMADLPKANYKKFLIPIFVLSFLFGFFNLAEATSECQLVNILTNRTEVGSGERMQVNVTAKTECIGKTARIHICNALQCLEIDSQTFSGSTLVFSVIPSDFFNEDTAVWMQATVPFNTVKSSPVSIVLDQNQGDDQNAKALFGEFCNEDEECASGLFCASNACVECDVNEVLSTCGSGQVCQDGACRSGADIEDNRNGSQSPGEGPLSNFPGEDLEANDVINIIIGLSCWLMRVASVLAVIFVIWVGLRFVSAQGNPTKYGDAVKSFQHVLFGILVIYGVYVIIATVAHAVGNSFSFIPLVC